MGTYFEMKMYFCYEVPYGANCIIHYVYVWLYADIGYYFEEMRMSVITCIVIGCVADEVGYLRRNATDRIYHNPYESLHISPATILIQPQIQYIQSFLQECAL